MRMVLFVYFYAFPIQFYRKIVDFSEIRSQIVGVDAEHADHLTTTTARLKWVFTVAKY